MLLALLQVLAALPWLRILLSEARSAGKQSGFTAHVERWNNTFAATSRSLRQEKPVIFQVRHDA